MDKAYKVVVSYDDWGHSSRTDWDNVGMLYSVSKYVPSDKDAESPDHTLVPDAEIVRWACEELSREDLKLIAWNRRSYGGTKAECVRDWIETACFGGAQSYPESLHNLMGHHAVILPVYAYVHSGVSVSTGGYSCPWDSGCIGVIWCTQEKAREEWGDDWADKGAEYLKGEIQTLDKEYAEGYRSVMIMDADGECVESCCGFLGWDADESGATDLAGDDEALADAIRKAFDNIDAEIVVDRVAV